MTANSLTLVGHYEIADRNAPVENVERKAKLNALEGFSVSGYATPVNLPTTEEFAKLMPQEIAQRGFYHRRERNATSPQFLH